MIIFDMQQARPYQTVDIDFLRQQLVGGKQEAKNQELFHCGSIGLNRKQNTKFWAHSFFAVDINFTAVGLYNNVVT